MIRYTQLPENIVGLLPNAVAYLDSASDVVFGYIFGGLAKGPPQPLSDVDIAVYIKEDSDVAETKLLLLGNLIDCLETDEIDLVILNTASLPLQMNILENRQVIVEKAPFVRHKFESLAMRKYMDFSSVELGILRSRYYG